MLDVYILRRRLQESLHPHTLYTCSSHSALYTHHWTSHLFLGSSLFSVFSSWCSGTLSRTCFHTSPHSCAKNFHKPRVAGFFYFFLYLVHSLCYSPVLVIFIVFHNYAMYIFFIITMTSVVLSELSKLSQCRKVSALCKCSDAHPELCLLSGNPGGCIVQYQNVYIQL